MSDDLRQFAGQLLGGSVAAHHVRQVVVLQAKQAELYVWVLAQDLAEGGLHQLHDLCCVSDQILE